MDAYHNDKRIIMTLQVGKAKFLFSAIQGNQKIVDNVVMLSNANDLDRSLHNIIEGFTRVKHFLPSEPTAISFAFPSLADYENGIIGDQEILPAYRGGVALGPMLSKKFNLPVFINNDGDLFAYGEAVAGFLPEVNSMLAKAGNSKLYKNLFGVVLDTTFTSGIISSGELYLGDNSLSGVIGLLRNKLSPQENVEEHASINGIQRIYTQTAEITKYEAPSPREIFRIAVGMQNGNRIAAVEAYLQMARVVGDAISNAVALLDGLVVIGGSLTCASSLFMPILIDEMNSSFIKQDGTKFKRLIPEVFNLELEDGRSKFVQHSKNEVSVFGTDEKVEYTPQKKIGVGISKNGKDSSIAIGAYSFALHKLDVEEYGSNLKSDHAIL